jgi:hypothetical protein
MLDHLIRQLRRTPRKPPIAGVELQQQREPQSRRAALTRYQSSLSAVVASLRARGAELVGEVERYEDSYRLCYVRGPEGIHRRAGGADRLRAPAGRQPPRQRQWSSRGRIRYRARVR